MKQAILTSILSIVSLSILAQDVLPQDYFTKEFHAGRREAARQMMPANSVMVVFAYPERNYSNDVSYLFHQNPDMYYFTGLQRAEFNVADI
jgi:Xaa-Pro aminopeptidase